MNLKGFSTLAVLLFITCAPTPPNWKTEIDELILKEKYAKALSLLENRLYFKHETKWKLSESKLIGKRIVRLSENRQVLIWAEEQTLFRWTLAEDKVESKSFPYIISDFAISGNGQMAVLQHKSNTANVCKITAYSFTDLSLLYESESYLDCNASFAISDGGNQIFYFLENDLFSEKTSLPKNPIRVAVESQYPPPFPKLKSKISILPFSGEFLIFSGIGGSYSLYQFNPNKEKLTLLSKEIVSPIYLPFEHQFGYVVSGKIGDLNLQPLVVTNNKTFLTKGFGIGYSFIHSQRLSTKDTFILSTKESPRLLQRWILGSKKESLPLFVERFWVLSNDLIAYENKVGDLVVGNLVFEEDEWKALEYFNKVRKMKEEESN